MEGTCANGTLSWQEAVSIVCSAVDFQGGFRKRVCLAKLTSHPPEKDSFSARLLLCGMLKKTKAKKEFFRIETKFGSRTYIGAAEKYVPKDCCLNKVEDREESREGKMISFPQGHVLL